MSSVEFPNHNDYDFLDEFKMFEIMCG